MAKLNLSMFQIRDVSSVNENVDEFLMARQPMNVLISFIDENDFVLKLLEVSNRQYTSVSIFNVERHFASRKVHVSLSAFFQTQCLSEIHFINCDVSISWTINLLLDITNASTKNTLSKLTLPCFLPVPSSTYITTIGHAFQSLDHLKFSKCTHFSECTMLEFVSAIGEPLNIASNFVTDIIRLKPLKALTVEAAISAMVAEQVISELATNSSKTLQKLDITIACDQERFLYKQHTNSLMLKKLPLFTSLQCLHLNISDSRLTAETLKFVKVLVEKQRFFGERGLSCLQLKGNELKIKDETLFSILSHTPNLISFELSMTRQPFYRCEHHPSIFHLLGATCKKLREVKLHDCVLKNEEDDPFQFSNVLVHMNHLSAFILIYPKIFNVQNVDLNLSYFLKTSRSLKNFYIKTNEKFYQTEVLLNEKIQHDKSFAGFIANSNNMETLLPAVIYENKTNFPGSEFEIYEMVNYLWEKRHNAHLPVTADTITNCINRITGKRADLDVDSYLIQLYDNIYLVPRKRPVFLNTSMKIVDVGGQSILKKLIGFAQTTMWLTSSSLSEIISLLLNFCAQINYSILCKRKVVLRDDAGYKVPIMVLFTYMIMYKRMSLMECRDYVRNVRANTSLSQNMFAVLYYIEASRQQ